ncbi:GMC family oxidoreductase [Halomarina litorea]|uniref:GMC family oxidoreductase n=1 Tax=Halomarina litorea TaxID=2961595 RepID=UPI0020C4388F|nr:GMC family oxidoreductase [Halomarina sp. BCD28]
MTGRTDVCVVGAGPAGALVAHRLASAGYDVTVLDAGPRFDGEDEDRTERMERALRPAHHPLSVWGMGGERDAYSTTGERHYPLNHARVKGVGGSTLHWQGMVMRLHEADFERRTRDGVGADWPLSYEDLQSYYAAAEREMGVAGASDNPFAPPREEPHPLPAFPPSYSDSLFAAACERLEIATHSVANARNSEPFDGRSPCVGYGTCRPVCPSGAKYTAEVHVRKAEAAGARVVPEAPVHRLETDASSERVVRAVYASGNGEETVEARQFVLAAGGVEIPRLLLLSASDRHPDGLANSSGLVGRYFMDHLFAGMGGTFDGEVGSNRIGFLTSESHQFYDDPGQASGSIPASDADLGPVKLEFLNYDGTGTVRAPSPVRIALDDGGWGDALAERIRERYGNGIAIGALVGQLPREENRVTLDPDTTDDYGNPVPDVQWHLDGRTRRTIERANEIQRAVMDELAVDIDWVVGPENTGPAFHHMGTTRMGADPETSVVDARLRTHDVANLTVASSSVFPTSGAMNPTLTIAALALKAADHVAADLSGNPPE